MSRCLPFPPPGYVWNGVGGEDLMKLIIKKLKKEGRRAKKERKKERRRQKKEMEKAKGDKEFKQTRQSSYKRVDSDESITDCGKNGYQPTRLYQTQVLRNCGLMEEIRQPMISDNSYEYSSGNFHNIKRKRPISPPNGCKSREEYFPHSNRLRCLLQKHKDSQVLLSKPLFFTPTRMDFVVQENVGMVLRPTKGQLRSGYIMPRTVVREVEPDNELSRSNSGSTEFIAHENVENASTSSLYESDSPQIESQLKELILDWIPSPVQSVRTEFDNQDWLFDTRLPGRQTDNNSNGCIAVSCSKNPTPLPHVHSTYAFPYTLPF